MKRVGLGIFEPFSDKVQRSIDFIREHEPPEGYYLCFSGGKDSIVCKNLLIQAGVKWIGVYSFPGQDPPELVRYIKKHHADIKIVSNGSFFKNVIKNGPPTGFRRWCCAIHKEMADDPNRRSQILGIRAEESPKRAVRGEISKFKKNLQYHPIFYWKEWEVWEYIENNKLPYCKLYDDPSVHRIGCCICPYMQPQARKKSIIRYPGYWKAYKKVLFIYYESFRAKEGKDGFYINYPTFEEFWHWLGEKGEWKPKSKAKNNLKIEMDK